MQDIAVVNEIVMVNVDEEGTPVPHEFSEEVLELI